MRIPTTYLLFILLSVPSLSQAIAPVVSNVRVAQRTGTKLVDIYYDLSKTDGGTCNVHVEISLDGGERWRAPATTFTGDIGSGISTGSNKLITWNAGADFDGNFADNCKARVTAYDSAYPEPPTGMVYIPAGAFQMGDNLDGRSNAPITYVFVSAFFMQRTEVTGDEWQAIYNWAVNHGYTLPNKFGITPKHPVHDVNWYEACTYANALSEYQGLKPCYYSDETKATVLRSATIPTVDWTANGYRLPTEAEWEKAARGGITGRRFPWGTDTIDHSQANYYAQPDNFDYDVNALEGTHPEASSSDPYTMPVASFPANAYGLYDMAGNVMEWCWDRHDNFYYGTDTTNPRGPDNGNNRILRGGEATSRAYSTSCADRGATTPSNSDRGFRLVRNASE